MSREDKTGMGCLNLVYFQISGYHRGQPGVVPVHNKLIEFFLGPGGAGLSTQVVENQEGRRLHLFEKLVVLYRAIGAVRGPQVVQQVRNEGEEGRIASSNALLNYSNGEVSLAASVGRR